MKLKNGFITHNNNGEHIMIAVGGAAKQFNGLVKSNKTAAAIIECLKNDVSEQDIVDTLCERFEADENRVAADVHGIIEKLRKIGALDE